MTQARVCYLGLWGLLLTALWATSLYSYLLFHSLAEFFSIIIAFCIFIVAWNSRRYMENGYLLFLGIAYLFVGLFDALHTLAYKGMGVFPGYGANLPTQFWIASRYLEAISLLVAPLFLRRKLHPLGWVLSYGLLTTLILLSTFAWNVFPDCYIEGQGLTWFKKGSEYLICLILLGAGAFLWSRRREFAPNVLHLLLWSIFFTVLAEVSFTFYVSVYGLSNLAGHLAKIVSFFLIYRALVVTGVARPQELVFKRLHDSEERYRTTLMGIGDGVITTDAQGRVELLNPIAEKLTGWRQERARGKPVEEVFQIFNEHTRHSAKNPVEQVLLNGQVVGLANHTILISRDGAEYPIADSGAPILNDEGQIVGTVLVFRDRTKERAAWARIEQQKLLLEAIAKGQDRFISEDNMANTFDTLLSDLLALTGSEYGFIGEVFYSEQGQPYFKTHALTNIAWDQETKNFYDQNGPEGLEFKNLDTLFGAALTSGQTVIANDPANDPRRGGLPPGHPPLTSFLCMPIRQSGDMVALAGVANRPGGYDQELLGYLDPLLSSIGQLVQAYRFKNERKDFENALARTAREWQGTFDASSDVIWLLDKGHRILRANQTAERVFGRSLDQIVGRKCWEIVHGAAQPPPGCPFARAEKSLHREAMELQAGSNWFLVTVDPIIDDEGQFAGAIHLISDINERKAAEEAAKEREAELTAIYENAPLIMMLLDQDRKILRINHVGQEFAGVSEADMIGVRGGEALRCLHSLDDERGCGFGPHCGQCAIRRTVLDTLETGRSYYLVDANLPFVLAGERKELSFLLSTSRIRKGQEHQALVILLDITERKESQERLAKLFRATPACVILATLEDGIYLEVNEAFERITGYSRAEVIGKTSVELGVWPHRQARQELVEKLRHQGILQQEPVQLRMKDGQMRDFLWSAEFIELEGPEQILTVLQDVTEQVRMASALRESEELFRHAFENANTGVCLVSTEGKLIRANAKLCEIIGYSREELEGRSVNDFAHPDDLDLSSSFTKHSLAGEVESTVFEMRYFHKDGHLVWGEVSSSLIRNAQGRPRFFISMVSDITRRKEALLRFQSLVESSPLGVALISARGDYLYLNPKFTEMFGYTIEDIPNGEEWLKRAFPEPSLRSQAREAWVQDRNSFRSGEVRLRIFDVTCKDGSRKTILFRPVGMEDGRQLVTYEDITEREQAKAALQKSQEKFATLYKTSPAWLILTTVDTGRFIEVNDAFCRAMGYGHDELIGRTSMDLGMWVNPNDRISYKALMESQGFITDFAIQFRQKDGSIRDFLWSAEKIEIDGEACAMSVLLDVTEIKRAREDLEKSEASYRALFDNMSDMICTHDMEGRITSINPVALKSLGYSMGEVRAAKLADFIPEQYRKEFYENYMKKVKDEGCAEGVMQMLAKDGSVRYLEYRNTLILRNGEEPYVSGVARDITDKIRAERALKESEAQFRAAFGNAPLGMALIDLERRFIRVNAPLCEMLGYSEDELLGKSFNQFTHPEDRQEGRDRWEELIAGRASKNQAEKRYLDKDGNIHWIIISNSALKDHQGRTHYMVSHFFDNTKYKSAQEASQRLETQLRQAQKMESIGTLAGGIAHDFNNILAAIMGYSELTLEHIPSGSQGHEYLTQVLIATARAQKLVKQILTFSRKEPIETKPLNINRNVKKAVDLVKQVIPRMVDVELHLDDNLRLISGDGGQIEQVLMNLITNANDAMAEGGRLVIETDNVTLDPEYCKRNLEAEPGDYVRLQVSDTGHGMTREVRDQIFDPFFTNKESGKGTGLGLSTSYGIVKAHGGFIYCYSEPGQGSTFKIYLPALQAEVTLEVASAKPWEEVVGGSETIMVVDDEKAILNLCQQMLSMMGYEVMTANSGEDALEIYKGEEGQIDLVILDLSMPGMGGHKCLLEMLKIKPEAKVLISSGYSRNGHLKESMAAGAAGFIGKPFQRVELLKKVRETLDK